ncbi:DUF2141 domain-containing protein [Inhella gelatinilytica]|uniref:DUF2141 domain-containing protein n=1 Tax=Inhella gelatinilytica TaxID=2795030 RepID=A0A931IY51_9BURK|nr:DUF2141 domain-containing protein [Inhella gelatinilytica]MBH9553751.1 DUF2141 domain-containing protein [Inhella gelatinilytica]
MVKRLMASSALAATLMMGVNPSAQAATLELTIEGLKASEGQLLVAVFDRPEVWLRGAALKGARVKVEGRSLTVVIDDLPDGAEVAVSAVQDLNGNGRMDRNAVGMPMEPYGFSRDAAGSFGPPSFEAAKITVQGHTKATLTLN